MPGSGCAFCSAGHSTIFLSRSFAFPDLIMKSSRLSVATIIPGATAATCRESTGGETEGALRCGDDAGGIDGDRRAELWNCKAIWVSIEYSNEQTGNTMSVRDAKERERVKHQQVVSMTVALPAMWTKVLTSSDLRARIRRFGRHHKTAVIVASATGSMLDGAAAPASATTHLNSASYRTVRKYSEVK